MIGKEKIEEAYIGTFLINGEDKELYGISENNFYNPIYKKIFSAIKHLIDSNVGVDLLTVSDQLNNIGDLEYIGGNHKLVNITNSEFSYSNRQYYSDILKEESKRVEVIKISDKLKFVAESGGKINGNIFNMAKELIELDTTGINKYDLEKDIEDTMNYLEDNRGKDMFGPAFGNEYLDLYTKGVRSGKIYRFGAESNLGKSWLAYNMVNSFLKQGKRIAFFTLENDKTMTITNLIANHMGVNPLKIENLEIQPDFEYLDKNKNLLSIVDDAHELSDIFSKTLQIKPDIVILDFIGLVNINGTEADKHYTSYAKQVQQFAKSEKISWIDLSNLAMDATPETMKFGGHFYGSSFLRNSNDVGVHMWYMKEFGEWRTNALNMSSSFEAKEKLKAIQVVWICITKNRFGKKGFEEAYKIDWDRGGRYIKATEEEIGQWKTSFI